MPIMYRCKCDDCGKGFSASRKDAKFCSAACRVAATRKRDEQDAIRNTSRNTLKAVTSTDTEAVTDIPGPRPVVTARVTDHSSCCIYPHDHPKGRTICSGRFWCESCEAWFSAPPCAGMTIPAPLMKLQAPGLAK